MATGLAFESVSENDGSNVLGAFSFPSATFSQNRYPDNTNEFFFQNEVVLSFLGEYTESQVAKVYSDPKDLLRFPMAVGDAFSDSYAAFWTKAGQNFSLAGTIEREVDGYGELRIQGGRFEEVLRVKTVENWTENGPNGAVNMRREYHSWFRGNAPAPLAELGYETNGTDTARFGSSVGAVIVCLCWGPWEDGFLMYPNPTRDVAQLRLELIDDAPVSMRVLDVRGRLVLEEDWGMLAAGEYDRRIDVYDLPHGVYLVQVRIGEQMYTKKLDVLK